MAQGVTRVWGSNNTGDCDLSTDLLCRIIGRMKGLVSIIDIPPHVGSRLPCTWPRCVFPDSYLSWMVAFTWVYASWLP